MKANELRLGNYVYFLIDNTKGLLSKIETNLDNKKLSNLLELSDVSNWYEPIPLTENWLLGLGFKSHGHGEYQKGDIFLDNEYTDVGVFNITINEDYCLSIEVMYVHQLQNLYFALTQEELTIRY